jgi:prepilin-type N-terminal cleavage/methylation domain-containing protein
VRPAGFTLLEVLVAAVLLVVAMVGSIGLILGMNATNRSTRNRDVAYLLAQGALEQLSAVPLVTLATANPAATAVPSAPTCFGMSNDSVLDRPIACPVGGGTASAYYLRTWVCCTQNPNAPPPYTLPYPPAVPITGAQCNVAVNVPGGQVVSPNQVNGGTTCLLEAEVTWPHESRANGQATAVQAPGYFVDPPTPPPVPLPAMGTSSADGKLSYLNHIFTAVVREQ